MTKTLALFGAAGLLALAAPHGARAASGDVTRDAAFCKTSGTIPQGTGYPFVADQYGNICVNVAVGGSGVATTPFTPLTPSVALTAGTTTSNVALTGGGTITLIHNADTTNTAYFALGNGGVTAATTATPIPAGGTIAVATGTATNLAAITASSTAILQITSGTGSNPAGWGGGAGSGGGVVTIPTGVQPYQGTAVTTDQLGVATTSAVGVTPPATSTYCLVTASVATVNWRADGTNPTTGASGGQPLGPGQFMLLGGALLNTMKFINNTGASGALLNISCFK